MVARSWVSLGAKIEPRECNHFALPPPGKIPVWIKEEENSPKVVSGSLTAVRPLDHAREDRYNLHPVQGQDPVVAAG